MSQLSRTAEVAIIGGGVIGLAVARALALRGVRDVLILERHSLGAESSSAAAGMLAPQAEANRAHEFFYLTCQSRDMYPAFAAALLDETGIDIEPAIRRTLADGHRDVVNIADEQHVAPGERRTGQVLVLAADLPSAQRSVYHSIRIVQE